MTVGQRISQKRKELGLSQEALGEQLGVSRQAIYKWESDATLPEIEKLVALCRIFSVSVGWLLGVEEDSSAGRASGELSETQLNMVKEIVAGYIAAQPVPEPQVPEKSKKRIFLRLLTAAAVVALIIAVFNLFSRLDQVQSQYNNLQNSISSLNSTVNGQIGSITRRVEDILKSQNELTADWSTEIKGMSYKDNTVTFTLTAIPKTYEEGMTALFVAQSGGKTFEAEGSLGEDAQLQTFEGDLTCELTDEIALSVVFITDTERRTQRLQEYSDLYRISFPHIDLYGSLWIEEEDGIIPAGSWVDAKDVSDFYDTEYVAAIAQVKVGLFRDQELVIWYEPGVREVYWMTDDGQTLVEEPGYRLPETITLEPGHIYSIVAVVTDEAGRERLYQDIPIEYDENDGWSTLSSYQYSQSPEGWKY